MVQKGFSLVEVLVALALISGVLTASAQSYLHLHQKWQSILTEQAVQQITFQFLHEIRMQYADAALFKHRWHEPLTSFKNCAGILCSPEESVTHQIGVYRQKLEALGAIQFTVQSTPVPFLEVCIAEKCEHYALRRLFE